MVVVVDGRDIVVVVVIDIVVEGVVIDIAVVDKPQSGLL